MADILHLYGNWKWTGPTELAVHLAESQTKAGHRVRMAFGRQRGADDHFTLQTKRRGITQLEGFELAKHFEPISLWRDARRLARLIDLEPPQIIHCHLQSDHLVAAFARKLTKTRIPVVRSTYEPHGPGSTRRERFSLTNATDRLLVACESARNAVRAGGTFDITKLRLVEPAIDTNRFDRARAVRDGRELLKLPKDAFVLGIVARVQARRRFDIFLEAARRLCGRDPGAHVVILGGGTHQYEVARKPVEQMGLSDRIHFPGVLRADEYAAALRSFNIKCYMTPGTDGTCRAVKEAMCSGVAVVVANTGMLPDLVKDRETGLVFDGSVEGLDRAIELLRSDPALRARLSSAGEAEARRRWPREKMRLAVEHIYSELTESAAMNAAHDH
ncbi:MAG: glycosyltransferase family 4 protein [Planctomycetes bacterium]|nr:glycosyltransferase family 4 protein [Planctomycetota bacterium]